MREHIQRSEAFLKEEVLVPQDQVLVHYLDRRPGLAGDRSSVRFNRVPAEEEVVFTDSFYFAKIGENEAGPFLLELRFEPISANPQSFDPSWELSEADDGKTRICLLMTNERYVDELETIGALIYNEVRGLGVKYDAIVAPDSLGTRISQEVARQVGLREGRRVFLTSLQKGKLVEGNNGRLEIGPPKEWVTCHAGQVVNSGTSREGSSQKLYLDDKIGRQMAADELKVLWLDDSCLSDSTRRSSLELLKRMGICVVATAAVMDEGSKEISEIKHTFLTKIPLLGKVSGGLKPLPASLFGIEEFWVIPGTTI